MDSDEIRQYAAIRITAASDHVGQPLLSLGEADSLEQVSNRVSSLPVSLGTGDVRRCLIDLALTPAYPWQESEVVVLFAWLRGS